MIIPHPATRSEYDPMGGPVAIRDAKFDGPFSVAISSRKFCQVIVDKSSNARAIRWVFQKDANYSR